MPLGECKACDTCGTLFWSDPVDQNDTCLDCIDRLPIPRCHVCDGLMKRDRKSTVCNDCKYVALVNLEPDTDSDD